MEQFMRRLLACERRTERFLEMIQDLRRQIRQLQQELRETRGGV